MESIYAGTSEKMGAYTGVTKGGFVIDETWLENDGLVNTVSALAPSSAPSTQYNAESVSKGIWNIMPIYHVNRALVENACMGQSVYTGSSIIYMLAILHNNRGRLMNKSEFI